jgi:hypothetical protein
VEGKQDAFERLLKKVDQRERKWKRLTQLNQATNEVLRELDQRKEVG